MRRATRLLPAFATAVALQAVQAGKAEAWRGEVLQVYAGDFIVVLYNKYQAQIQLHGVALPAKEQPLGRQAKRLTSRRVSNKTVRVLPTGAIHQGRILARVYVGKECLNEELVRAGLARWDRQQAPKDTRLAELEAEARGAGRGIWSSAGQARSPGEKERCTSPPGPPCRAHRACAQDKDCVLVPKAPCTCPPCSGATAWPVNRGAHRQWNAFLERAGRRCPKRKCARCGRRARAVCVKGECSL